VATGHAALLLGSEVLGRGETAKLVAESVRYRTNGMRELGANERFVAARDKRYVKAAEAKFQSDDDVDVDGDAKVSWSRNGAYVQVWAWIQKEEAEA
jgi:hypothetical protein